MPSIEFPAATFAAVIAAYRKKFPSVASRLGVDPEDVEQDLTTIAVEAWPLYQEWRGSTRTFLDRVVRNALASLGRRGTTQKRDRSRLLADGEAAVQGAVAHDGDRARCEARLETEEVLALLGEADRSLCRELATACVAAAAERCGLTRQQVYRRLAAIARLTERERGHSGPGPRM